MGCLASLWLKLWDLSKMLRWFYVGLGVAGFMLVFGLLSIISITTLEQACTAIAVMYLTFAAIAWGKLQAGQPAPWWSIFYTATVDTVAVTLFIAVSHYLVLFLKGSLYV